MTKGKCFFVNICGIVSEYNPFHAGHSYHIAQTRALLGTDCGIVCCMSGNFVQRGEAAVFAKHARAEAAVRCGADLVLELPLPWALSSAEGFARGAVAALAATGAVTHLSFGSECGDIRQMLSAAETLLHPDMDELIRAELQSGISYPAARQRAAEHLTGKPMDLLASPNDLLGIEYIKAIRRFDFPMTPVAVPRKGAGHDSTEEAVFPSASLLRRKIADGAAIDGYIPAEAYAVFQRETQQGRGAVLPEMLESAVLSRLRMRTAEDFARLPDASEGLGARLYRAARTQPSLDAILAEAKTRRYTFSRLRRMIMCAALGLRAEDAEGYPPYIRVLSAGEKGLGILKTMQQSAWLPVIIKPAAVRELDAKAKHVFQLESDACDLYALACLAQAERRGEQDWRTSPVIVK